MSAFTPAATLEAAALAKTALGDRISLHTASPGTTGANEATGGNPAYARLQTTWAGGAVDGAVPGSPVMIDVPAGTYTHFGIWSASGTYVDGGTIAPTTLAAQGQIKVTPTMSET
jgi:hypothetical protein